MHTPVLLKEVLEIFNPQAGETYIDATVNGGGHSLAILERVGPNGKVLGIDWDSELIEELKIKSEELRARDLKLVCGNYANIRSIARKYHLGKIDGILFDLGFSSYHLEKSKRGFSFLRDEILDMRYNPNEHSLTAEIIINKWSRSAIEIILRDYGEERFASRISEAIIRHRSSGRKVTRTTELVDIIKKSLPPRYLRAKIHPATRTFQALRIAVNNELENLKKALQESFDLLGPRARIVIITFHSLEDRIVKSFFKEKVRDGLVKVLTPKPTVPSKEEIAINRRARSAKLRAAEILL